MTMQPIMITQDSPSLPAETPDLMMMDSEEFTSIFGPDGLGYSPSIEASSAVPAISASPFDMIAANPFIGVSSSSFPVIEGSSSQMLDGSKVDFASFLLSPSLQGTSPPQMPGVPFSLYNIPPAPVAAFDFEPSSPSEESLFSDSSADAVNVNAQMNFPECDTFFEMEMPSLQKIDSYEVPLDLPMFNGPFSLAPSFALDESLDLPSGEPVSIPEQKVFSFMPYSGCQAAVASDRSYFKVDMEFPWEVYVQDSERRDRILKWKKKKVDILRNDKVRKNTYKVRKDVADRRLRIKGRFVGKCID